MKLTDITPVFLTFNEEVNIGRSLEQVSWASRIVVLDSGSTDSTETICRNFPAVFWQQRSFDAHAPQWNHALSLAGSSWVLTLDADYLVSDGLLNEIMSLPESPAVDGYLIPFVYQIHGQSLSQTLLPPRLALFKKEKGRYLQDGHTQDLFLAGKSSLLKNPIYHDDRKPFSRWWAAQEKYADLEVEKLSRIPWKELRLQDRLRRMVFPAPVAVLFYTLFVKRAFLDGKAGYIYTTQRFLAEALLSFKLIVAWLKS